MDSNNKLRRNFLSLAGVSAIGLAAKTAHADHIENAQNIRASIPLTHHKSIVIEDANAVAYDNKTGQIIASSNDHASVIQFTINSLTSQREYSEQIKFIGSFNPENSINIPSFTKLDFSSASFDVSVNNSNSVFESIGSTAIAILSGHFKMPVGTGSFQRLVTLIRCTEFDLIGINSQGSGSHAVEIRSQSTNGNIHGCRFDKYGDDGISILSSNNITIISNSCSNGLSTAGGSTGIEIEDFSSEITVIGNRCFGNERGIQSVVDSGVSSKGNHNILIQGNICHDNTSAGILCQYAGTTSTSYGHSIKGNSCNNNGTGIGVYNIEATTVDANTINGTSKPNGQGIRVIAGNGTVISNNLIRESRGNGIEVTGDTTDCIRNTIKNCGKDGNNNHNYGIRYKSSHRNCSITNNKLIDSQATKTMGGINTFDGKGISIKHNHFNGLADTTIAGTKAIYIQSADGKILISKNTHEESDTVSFITEFEGQVEGASPIVLTHDLQNATSTDVILYVTPMSSGVTEFYVEIHTNKLTITYSGSGTKRFSYTVKTNRV